MTSETPMTLDLAALEALEKAATPGPWELTMTHWVQTPDGNFTAYVNHDAAPKNAAFIVAVRNAAEEMVGELKRLRDEDRDLVTLAEGYFQTVDHLTKRNREMHDRAQKAETERDALRAERDKLRCLVRDVEWESGGYCPWCSESEDDGHLHDCHVRAALGEEPAR